MSREPTVLGEREPTLWAPLLARQHPDRPESCPISPKATAKRASEANEIHVIPAKLNPFFRRAYRAYLFFPLFSYLVLTGRLAICLCLRPATYKGSPAAVYYLCELCRLAATNLRKLAAAAGPVMAPW